MPGQSIGAGGERKARAEREDSLDRREERRLHEIHPEERVQMPDKPMLQRFSVWPDGQAYALTVQGSDGSSLDLGATPEQLDELIKALDVRLRTDKTRPSVASHGRSR